MSDRLLDVLANAIAPAVHHLFKSGEIDEVVVEALPRASGDVRSNDAWRFAKIVTQPAGWLEMRAGEDRFGDLVYQEAAMQDHGIYRSRSVDLAAAGLYR